MVACDITSSLYLSLHGHISCLATSSYPPKPQDNLILVKLVIPSQTKWYHSPHISCLHDADPAVAALVEDVQALKLDRLKASYTTRSLAAIGAVS